MMASGAGWLAEESRLPESSAREAVELVFTLDPDVTATNDTGETALHAAAARGADSIVRLLIAHGAQVNARNKRGETPLTFAQGDFGNLVHGAYESTVEVLGGLGGTR
jgi:hypothetical protein